MTFAVAAVGLASLAAVALSPGAEAQALIATDRLALGVQALGHLGVVGAASPNCGTPLTALRFDDGGMPLAGQEALDCDVDGEGWGLAYEGGPSMWAMSGAQGCGISAPPPTLVSFIATPVAARSVVQVGDIELNQTYAPIPWVDNAFWDVIQVRNTGAATVEGIQYRRVMSFGSGLAASVGGETLTLVDTNPTGYPVPPADRVPLGLVDSGLVSGSTCADPTGPIPFATVGADTWRGPPSAARLVDNGHNCPSTCVAADVAFVLQADFGSLEPGEARLYALYYGGGATVGEALQTIVDVEAPFFALARAPGSPEAAFFMGYAALCTDCPGGPTNPPPPRTPDVGIAFEQVPPGSSATGTGPSHPPTHATSSCTAALRIRVTGTSAPPASSWTWEFGDSSPPVAGNPAEHTYASPGTYLVRATAVVDGVPVQSSREVRLTGPEPCPPRIDGMPLRALRAGQALRVCATGHAALGGTLSFSARGLPTGAIFQSGPACILWTPTIHQVGRVECILVTVTETPSALTDSTCQAIQVLPPTAFVADRDMDGVADDADNCPLVPNWGQADEDNDGKGDACDGPMAAAQVAEQEMRKPPGERDTDQDGVPDTVDNCAHRANHGQEDRDGDMRGDLCDPDADGDGAMEVDPAGRVVDNCPAVANRKQEDVDGDGIGDACQAAEAQDAGTRLATRNVIPPAAGGLPANVALAWAAGLSTLAVPLAGAGWQWTRSALARAGKR